MKFISMVFILIFILAFSFFVGQSMAENKDFASPRLENFIPDTFHMTNTDVKKRETTQSRQTTLDDPNFRALPIKEQIRIIYIIYRIWESQHRTKEKVIFR